MEGKTKINWVKQPIGCSVFLMENKWEIHYVRCVWNHKFSSTVWRYKLDLGGQRPLRSIFSLHNVSILAHIESISDLNAVFAADGGCVSCSIPVSICRRRNRKGRSALKTGARDRLRSTIAARSTGTSWKRVHRQPVRLTVPLAPSLTHLWWQRPWCRPLWPRSSRRGRRRTRRVSPPLQSHTRSIGNTSK